MIINPNYPAAPQTAQLIFNEVVIDDCYRVRALKQAPAVVYDIGANIGMFSIMARMLWPQAEIHALEPVPETFAILETNTAHLHIRRVDAALGTGAVLCIDRNAHSDGSNRLTATGPGVAIKTMRLAEIVGDGGPYLIKLDCEAAEASIIGDAASERVLANALHWAMEYHQNWVGIAGEKFLAKLQRIDPRATGKHYRGNDWLFWSAQS
jgi:FkbM family methyltransferase